MQGLGVVSEVQDLLGDGTIALLEVRRVLGICGVRYNKIPRVLK